MVGIGVLEREKSGGPSRLRESKAATLHKRSAVKYQVCGSSRKTTYEELHTELGTEPWGWVVTMILKSSGEAARSVMSDCLRSGARGCAIARCSRILKIISSAGASGGSTPPLRN